MHRTAVGKQTGGAGPGKTETRALLPDNQRFHSGCSILWR